jgi:DNA modification methylase
VWTIGRESNYDHPTQKPIQLIEKALMNSSRIGELVIDFFGGSGSLMIACEKTKRYSCTMELDSYFCDIITSRYVEYTGKKTIKINGKEVDWTKMRKEYENNTEL